MQIGARAGVTQAGRRAGRPGARSLALRLTSTEPRPGPWSAALVRAVTECAVSLRGHELGFRVSTRPATVTLVQTRGPGRSDGFTRTVAATNRLDWRRPPGLAQAAAAQTPADRQPRPCDWNIFHSLVGSSQRPPPGRPAVHRWLRAGTRSCWTQCTTTAAGALRVTVSTDPSNTSDRAPPLVPFTEPVDSRTSIGAEIVPCDT